MIFTCRCSPWLWFNTPHFILKSDSIHTVYGCANVYVNETMHGYTILEFLSFPTQLKIKKFAIRIIFTGDGEKI